MSESELLSPEKQEQILRGAASVFAEDGYEGASMSRIAARVIFSISARGIMDGSAAKAKAKTQPWT